MCLTIVNNIRDAIVSDVKTLLGWKIACAAFLIRRSRAQVGTSRSDRWPADSTERTRRRANSPPATRDLRAVPGTRTAPVRGHLERREIRPRPRSPAGRRAARQKSAHLDCAESG